MWRDPLFSPGDRFPLGPPKGVWDNCLEGPSDTGARPFSLRGVVAGGRMDTPRTQRLRYDVERQIALVVAEDGEGLPLLRHTQPGVTPGQTSGGTDSRSPGSEEMGPSDWQQT
jgi:hypothetical protein